MLILKFWSNIDDTRASKIALQTVCQTIPTSNSLVRLMAHNKILRIFWSVEQKQRANGVDIMGQTAKALTLTASISHIGTWLLCFNQVQLLFLFKCLNTHNAVLHHWQPKH